MCQTHAHIQPFKNKPILFCAKWRLFVSALQLSFQMWTDQIQETLNSKKRGDTAFRAKEFEKAIECYTHGKYFICKFSILLYYLQSKSDNDFNT